VALSAAEREEFVMPCVSRADHDIVVAPLQ
jgi:hypothetical protein